MNQRRFVTAAEAMESWRDDLFAGKPPTFFPVAESGPLSRIEVGPKLITLIGGSPGAGKSALTMQLVTDALRLTPDLRAVVCNVEMPPEVLLDRQLSRLSGVPLEAIRYRRLEQHHAERIDSGLATIESFADRLCFVRPPFDLANVAATADEFAPLGSGGGLLLIFDYLQRFSPAAGSQSDKRGSVDLMMNYLRQFADAGASVFAVSAVGRQRDGRGRSTYSGDAMNLASFKESGELEFGADDAFILAPSATLPGVRELKHLKARHSEPQDVLLRFDGSIQSFTPYDADGDSGGLSNALSAVWNRAESAGGEPWNP